MTTAMYIGRRFCWLLLLAVLGCQPGPNPPPTVVSTSNVRQREYPGEEVTVVEVKDGDSVIILCNGGRFEVRLAWVDAPEADQPFGVDATRFTADKVLNKRVRFVKTGSDYHERGPVGELTLANGQSLCEELVRNGYAWNYWYYTKPNPEKFRLFDNLEREAKDAKRGLWQGENPIYPREWRQWKYNGIVPIGSRD